VILIFDKNRSKILLWRILTNNSKFQIPTILRFRSRKTVAHLEEGFVFRRVNKGDNLMGESITPQAIRDIVVSYAGKLENQGIAPHDLRRTFAKLAHKGGSPIDQIQLSLGHDSIQTTEKYLGVEQDLTDAPCDHLGLRISN